MYVGGGRVDRRHHAAVAGVRLEAGVHRAGGEAAPAHETSDSSRPARVTIPTGLPFSVTVSAWRSPESSSTASRTGSPVATAGNGASITSTMSADISPGLSIARLRRPRSPTD